MLTQQQNALACARRVFDFIEEQPEEPDAASAVELKNPDGSMTLEHVSFSYNPEIKLLQDLNLKVKPDQKIAIVGPTGCGKTTLINLLMRFYDIQSGEIRVSNTGIQNITRDSLRANFGMVLQETWLKAGTIAENSA